MFMRLPNAEFRAGQGSTNRRRLGALVKKRPPGLLAYEHDVPVGWIAIAPREEFVRLENSRVLAPVPGERVWSAPCFFVRAGHRGKGLSGALLKAAVAYARAQGAAHVEGYPHADTAAKQPAAFVWSGFESVYQAQGFTEIARRSKGRPIMRRSLKKGAKHG
ncbi:MAG: GNAT family N-acetyltransferase [Candidatus Eisenbacteria bacterium]|nr:GNAT family N-acetyltransferase [Candidatus Eisenbacteria bacterium]